MQNKIKYEHHNCHYHHSAASAIRISINVSISVITGARTLVYLPGTNSADNEKEEIY